MLQNAYFLAKIGADTAENEQHFAEILPTDAAPANLDLRQASPVRLLLGVVLARRDDEAAAAREGPFLKMHF